MRAFLKYLYSLLALIGILVCFDFIYTSWFYQDDLVRHSPIIEEIHKIESDTEIIYIGESSNTTYSVNDIDKRPISSMLQDYFPEQKIQGITKPAGHAEVFEILLSRIPKENKIKTVIVTMNLRSFNADWINSKLETSIQKELVLLRNRPNLYNRFMLSFKGYDNKTLKERSAQVQEDLNNKTINYQKEIPISTSDWLDNFKNKNNTLSKAQFKLAKAYIRTYGFQVDTLTNPRIHEFENIIKLAKERNWNLVFNILAENTEKANKIVGEDLKNLMNYNSQILENYFTNRGIKTINCINMVDDKDFIDQDWTTEHYTQSGRKRIALECATAINEFVEDEIFLE